MVWCFADHRDNCKFILSHITKLRMEIYGSVHFTYYVHHGKRKGEEFQIFHSVTIISTKKCTQLHYIYNNIIRTSHSYMFRTYWPSRESIIILKLFVDILLSYFYTEELPAGLLARDQPVFQAIALYIYCTP